MTKMAQSQKQPKHMIPGQKLASNPSSTSLITNLSTYQEIETLKAY